MCGADHPGGVRRQVRRQRVAARLDRPLAGARRARSAILMNTRGLMELIVLNIGLDLGVISPTLFTMMVIMALVTTFMTTPLLRSIYPFEEMARDRTLAEPGRGARGRRALRGDDVRLS